MDLFGLAKTITVKMEGDVDDFLDYLIIIRSWMDKNFALSEDLMNGFNVSHKLAESDGRFKSLREQIWKKPIHNENKKPQDKWNKRLKQIRNIENIKKKQKEMKNEFFKEGVK